MLFIYVVRSFLMTSGSEIASFGGETVMNAQTKTDAL